MEVREFEAVVGGGEGRLPLVEVPFDVKEAYGTARPKVKATVNHVTLRTTVSVYGGRSYVGFRKEIQEAAGIRIGDRIRVRIEPDVEPREIEVPDDLARALGKDRAAGQAFERLSYTHRKEYVQWVVEAKLRSPKPVSVAWRGRSRCCGPARSTPERDREGAITIPSPILTSVR
jgi:Bacteriocin-protection, YdeI or OmpD-Associated/Domain of unknown function (DUF1905)